MTCPLHARGIPFPPFSTLQGGSYSGARAGAAAASGAAAAAGEDADDSGREAELAEAKETLRLLQLQTLKFSTFVVIFQVGACDVALQSTLEMLFDVGKIKVFFG